MSDSVKKTVGVVIAVLLLARIISWFFQSPSAGGSVPDVTVWVCQDKACGNEFRKTEKELATFYAKNAGQPLPCPKCSKTEVVRGIECTHCKKVCTKPRGETECPSCGKDLYQAPK